MFSTNVVIQVKRLSVIAVFDVELFEGEKAKAKSLLTTKLIKCLIG